MARDWRLAMAASTRLTTREGRKFAFTVGAAFVVLGGLSAWRGHQLPPRVLWALGSALLVAGVLIPSHLTGVQRGWMRLGNAIARVTAPIMAGALYLLILTPIGLLMRIFGKNPLRPREHDGGLWMPASPEGRSNLENQY